MIPLQKQLAQLQVRLQCCAVPEAVMSGTESKSSCMQNLARPAATQAFSCVKRLCLLVLTSCTSALGMVMSSCKKEGHAVRGIM